MVGRLDYFLRHYCDICAGRVLPVCGAYRFAAGMLFLVFGKRMNHYLKFFDGTCQSVWFSEAFCNDSAV